MGSLIKQPKIRESPEQRAERLAAEQERIEATRDRAADETERLFRLFGARSALNLGSRFSLIAPMAK